MEKKRKKDTDPGRMYAIAAYMGYMQAMENRDKIPDPRQRKKEKARP